MAYALDDGWDNCTPVARAGNAAFGVYSRCGIWVARNLTDGFIPGEIATAYGSPELARKLVDVGLWEAVEGGYVAVDYLLLNPTAEKVKARRKADAERKARWRDRAHRARVTRDETRESERSHGVTPRVSPRSPAPPKGGGDRPPASRDGADGPEDTRDYRSLPAFGIPRDPLDAQRVHRGAAQARASIKPPTKRVNGHAGAFDELVAVTTAPDPPPHTFDDDGTGACLRCSKPYGHNIHAVGDQS